MRPGVILSLYFLLILVAAVVLGRTLYQNARRQDILDEPVAAHQMADCHTLSTNLRDELLAWYLDDIKALGPAPLRREAYPGRLREWEAARMQGETRCVDQREAFATLQRLRRTLESNAYLLSQTAGRDIAALRGAGERHE